MYLSLIVSINQFKYRIIIRIINNFKMMLRCKTTLAVGRYLHRCHSSFSSASYDIVVSGGGSVSVSFLLSMVKCLSGSLQPGAANDLPIKILLVENRSSDSIKALGNIFSTTSPDLRVYAINSSSLKFLDDSCGGVLSHESIANRTRSYDGMSIWDAQGPGCLMFSSQEIGKRELGRVVEDVSLQASLYSRLESVSSRSTNNTSGADIDNSSHKNTNNSSKSGSSSDHNSNDSDKIGGLDIYFGTSVVDVQRNSNSNGDDNDNSIKNRGSIKVSIKNNVTNSTSHVFTKLLIGADGANSFVRKAVDIPTKSYSYGEEGIVVSVELENKSSNPANNSNWNSVAYQRYLKTGPLAILPCFKNYASLVWTLPSSLVKETLALSDEEFLIKLNKALQSPISSVSYPPIDRREKSPLNMIKNEVVSLAQTIENGMIHLSNQQMPHDLRGKSQIPIISRIASKRASFPLQCQHVTQYALPGVVLLGDAAHSIHPHAGQGLNLGFADARDLSEVLANALKVGADIGSMTCLKAYHDMRYPINAASLAAVHALHEIFVLNSAAKGGDNNIFDDSSGNNKKLSLLKEKIVWLRSVGMLAINTSSSLKKLLAKAAGAEF